MTFRPLALVAAALLARATPAHAHVSYTQEGKLTIKLPFGLGKVKTKTFVSGDRKREEIGDRLVRIVRLDEEAIDTLDLKKKTWYRTTFAEMRADLERALAEIDARAAKESGGKDGKPPEVVADLEVDDTGRKDTVAGHACGVTRVRVILEGKDPDSGQAGKMSLDNDLCLSTAFEGGREAAAFERRFAEKLGAAQVFARAGMFDMAQQKSDAQFRARVRMAEATSALEGFPLRVVTRFGAAGAAGSAAPTPVRAGSDEGGKGGLGGLFGKLGKKDGSSAGGGEASGESGFGFVMEVQETSTEAIDPAQFEIPDGFKREARPDPFKK